MRLLYVRSTWYIVLFSGDDDKLPSTGEWVCEAWSAVGACGAISAATAVVNTWYTCAEKRLVSLLEAKAVNDHKNNSASDACAVGSVRLLMHAAQSCRQNEYSETCSPSSLFWWRSQRKPFPG